MCKYKMCPITKDYCMGSKCAMWVENAQDARFGACAFASIAMHMPDSADVNNHVFYDPEEVEEEE